jgi:hypothetical protein
MSFEFVKFTALSPAINTSDSKMEVFLVLAVQWRETK